MNLYNVLIDYIENNKTKNKSYEETFDYLDELLRTLKRDYENLESEQE